VSEVRILTPDDTLALETFLSAHWESSTFLRSNVRKTPIGQAGRFSGRYAAKFEDGRVTDVAAYYTTYGNIVVQAPTNIESVVAACIPPGKPVNGLLGPWDQVEAAVSALDLGARKPLMDMPEVLYALDLERLETPESLDAGTVRYRGAVSTDLDMLAKWRAAYSIEALFARDDVELLQRARDDVSNAIASGDMFVLELAAEAGHLIAMAAYNANLTDIVQIGGVWTPPDLRGKGYGRAVTAGALLAARDTGVSKSVLFTPISNVPAQKAYEALGFEAVGRYGVRLYDV
jgi:uncharacterized protein